VLGWLFVGVLGIIWAAFFIPYIRHGRSPASSVEEFERKMDLLAETNRGPRGRWVLMPRKDERFLGPRDRSRSRLRRRRRQVFNLLGEATGLSLLIGLFPPFHRVLLATGVLVALFVAYAAVLARIRVGELERARVERRLRAQGLVPEPVPVPAPAYASTGNGHLRSYGRLEHGRSNGAGPAARPAVESGVRMLEDDPAEITIVIDEDVHLVVHRSDEVDLRELRTATR
jgi:hypothetical protein